MACGGGGWASTALATAMHFSVVIQQPPTTGTAYTLAYHTESGETLCANCAADPANDAAFCDTYYEGPTIYCDGCNAEIESSYGDPDDKSDE
jgi:hypothetical protein